MLPPVMPRYKVLEPLGRGGMGVVYRGRDLELDREVALKFLPYQMDADEIHVKRFLQEAKAASSLDHPNICTIHDIGKTPDGQLFIVMAVYEGETVRQKLGRGPLPATEAIDIAIQILAGLAGAHAKNIAHCDIKPSNIIITPSGLVKILDFGVAKLMGEVTIGKGATVTGTVAYMSPEQLEGKAGLSSDIWSAGVCLYEMLTGERPFQGETYSAVIHAIFHSKPRPIRSYGPKAPFHIDGVINRALERNTQVRYQTADQMLTELRHSGSGEMNETVPISRASTSLKAVASRQTLPSVAVLPFTNLSPDEENEYFSDGISEELIHTLSQLKGLHVVSRTSAFQFKKKAQDVREIANRLGVSTVLEGSVRRASNRLRITVLLTNAADGYSIWSRRFDREAGDIFAVQDEIAASVVNVLLTKLNVTEELEVGRKITGNMEAWNLYLKGRFYWHKATEDAYRKAREFFQQAIQADPGCAPAYSGLADFYRSLAFWGFMDPREAWRAAHEYASKALELDPDLPQAHITMARYAQQMQWNRDAAEQEFRRAIELNAGYSEAHLALAVFQLQARHFDEALAELRLARDLDPLNLAIATAVAWLHYYRGEYDQATSECRKALDMEPDYFEALCCMAMVSERREDFEAAGKWWEHGWLASGKSPIVSGFVGRYYAITGSEAKSREIIAQLEELSSKRYVSRMAFAFIYAGLNDVSTAIEYIEKAFEEHDSFLSYAEVFPPFDGLRQHPRFLEILRQIGLADSGGKSAVGL